jgi:hypothetical protein
MDAFCLSTRVISITSLAYRLQVNVVILDVKRVRIKDKSDFREPRHLRLSWVRKGGSGQAYLCLVSIGESYCEVARMSFYYWVKFAINEDNDPNKNNIWR